MAFPLEMRFVEAAEKAIGRRFPQSYVRFMCKTNGGTTPDSWNPCWELHPIYDTSDRRRISRTCNHVLRETERARQYNGFPAGAVVIGEDLEHTLLLLLPDPADDGRFGNAVYSWHPFHQDLIRVVSDFSEFGTEAP